MTARMHAVDPWKHENSTMEECNASCSRSDQQIHGTFRQAADHSNSAMEAQASCSYPAAAVDHSNSAMEAQASGSYPAAAAADHSNSAMEAQASGSYPAAADHSNSAMEAQASGSYPAAAAGKQQIVATLLWKRRLVAAFQQLYKLLYKSCIEAKQNNAQV